MKYFLFLIVLFLPLVSAQTYFYAGSSSLAVKSDAGIEYLFHDRLGGDIASISLPFGQALTTTKRFSFTGKELDSSELFYFGARYYDKDLGRFTSVDPVEHNHAYNYVDNMPLNYIDPTGMDGFFASEPDNTRIQNPLDSSPMDWLLPRGSDAHSILDFADKRLQANSFIRIENEIGLVIKLFTIAGETITDQQNGNQKIAMYPQSFAMYDHILLHELGHALQELSYVDYNFYTRWNSHAIPKTQEFEELQDELYPLVNDFLSLSSNIEYDYNTRWYGPYIDVLGVIPPPSGFVSYYAKANNYEDFAETFRFVMRHTPQEVRNWVGDDDIRGKKVDVMYRFIDIIFNTDSYWELSP